MYAFYARLFNLFNYWTFLPGLLHCQDSNICNEENGVKCWKRPLLNERPKFFLQFSMRKPLLKWKYICIKPDSILQSGIIKTAIYKMKNHITRIHFEKCHNKGGFCGNGRTWISNYILQWAIIKYAEHTYIFIRNNQSCDLSGKLFYQTCFWTGNSFNVIALS